MGRPNQIRDRQTCPRFIGRQELGHKVDQQRCKNVCRIDNAQTHLHCCLAHCSGRVPRHEEEGKAQDHKHEMGVNPVSGYFHDHLFVPDGREKDALKILRKIAADHKTD